MSRNPKPGQNPQNSGDFRPPSNRVANNVDFLADRFVLWTLILKPHKPTPAINAIRLNSDILQALAPFPWDSSCHALITR